MTGLELLKEHVTTLNRRGLGLDIWDHAGQAYVHAPAIKAPSPPWDKPAYEILIAVSVAYDLAALDSFYLCMPYKFKEGTHPRVENGGIVAIQGCQWRLVSWHYPDGKPWQSGRDTLESHIVHCAGFFLHRGATNDYH